MAVDLVDRLHRANVECTIRAAPPGPPPDKRIGTITRVEPDVDERAAERLLPGSVRVRSEREDAELLAVEQQIASPTRGTGRGPRRGET
jgi:hypothetical protein